jgi:N-glycosylase/DNA lyase
VQIQQIVRALCECFGSRVAVPAAHEAQYAFPTPEQVASAAERDLRACKMGFRAPNLLATARIVAAARSIWRVSRSRIVKQRGPRWCNSLGVGGEDRELRAAVCLWFSRRLSSGRVGSQGAVASLFSAAAAIGAAIGAIHPHYFGPNSGYAQQYLFHYMRTQMPRTRKKAVEKRRRKAAQ